jgi:hypothetical protein
MAEYNVQEKPVIFIEQAVDGPVDSSRKSRWWSAYSSGGSVSLPLIMVDSGNQISNGYVDHQTVYSNMIDTALTRPPGAAISAVVSRVGDSLHFDIDLTNLSGVTLSSANKATLYAIVYDDNSTSGLTGSYVVSSVSAYIAPSLPSGDSGNYTLQTGDLTDVVWSSIRAVVFVDYRPASSNYDMLQLAIETEPEAVEDAMKSLLILTGQNPAAINEIDDRGNDGKIGLEEAIRILQQNQP